jgi:hypothetical protein
MKQILVLALCLLGTYLGFSASSVGLSFWLGAITVYGSLLIQDN